MGTWRRHSREFKLSVVERMKRSDNLHELDRELKFEGRPEKNHANYLGSAPADAVEARLRRENKELKESLGESEGGSPEQRCDFRSSVYAEIQAQSVAQGKLTVEQMCWLAQVSRAGYYRNLAQQQPEKEDTEVRSAIQEIVLSHRRRYGYRRVTVELRRRGFEVNHKRVSRLMREDNLLGIRQRRFVITTDAQHELEVYLNLAKRIQVSCTPPILRLSAP